MGWVCLESYLPSQKGGDSSPVTHSARTVPSLDSAVHRETKKGSLCTEV